MSLHGSRRCLHGLQSYLVPIWVDVYNTISIFKSTFKWSKVTGCLANKTFTCYNIHYFIGQSSLYFLCHLHNKTSHFSHPLIPAPQHCSACVHVHTVDKGHLYTMAQINIHKYPKHRRGDITQSKKIEKDNIMGLKRQYKSK